MYTEVYSSQRIVKKFSQWIDLPGLSIDRLVTRCPTSMLKFVTNSELKSAQSITL